MACASLRQRGSRTQNACRSRIFVSVIFTGTAEKSARGTTNRERRWSLATNIRSVHLAPEHRQSLPNRTLCERTAVPLALNTRSSREPDVPKFSWAFVLTNLQFYFGKEICGVPLENRMFRNSVGHLCWQIYSFISAKKFATLGYVVDVSFPPGYLSLTSKNIKLVSQPFRCPTSYYKEGYWGWRPKKWGSKIVEKTQILVVEW